MTTPPPRTMMSVRVSAAGATALRRIAAALGISVSQALRDAIRDYVAAHAKLLAP